MSRIEEALKKVAGKRQEARVNSLESHVQERIPPQRDLPQKKTLATTKPLLDVTPIQINDALIPTALDEKTVAVEEFNKLRSAVIALTKSDTLLNTLMITSTASEEGKSMTSLNLAISLAKEHDHTVLLVDADLRRPSLHRYLGLTPKAGLVHCLREGLPIEQALIKTGIGKLVFLPAGEAVRDPLDMLSSNRMKEIVAELKQRYEDRYVIFDTPPAHPFADAGVLAAIVDATLFVVREGKADYRDLLKTLDTFKEQNLLGLIYNDSHRFMKKQDYYYY